MENLELDGLPVSNGEVASASEQTLSENSAEISTESQVASKGAEESALPEEGKSALDNYVDRLDRDYTDEEDDYEEDDSIEDSEEDDGEISFADLGLDETVLAAIEKKGFKHPSPIQVLAIPRLLNGDANIIAKARTGTGKTAAFGLPIVQRVHEESDHVRAVILEPTRELAIQTCNELQTFTSGKFPRTTVLYGGASYRDQIRDLKRGCEIVVGTPGRIQDHLERGTLKLDQIDYFILDEGDEMLDMGFIDDIEHIFEQAKPDARILLFSATMPKPILRIAEQFMGDYEVCEEEGFVEEPLLIDQKYWFVREGDKIEALVRIIDMSPNFYGLVFTQTKNDADNVTRMLDEKGYDVAALHGDIPQGQREKILARFRSRKTRVLVATDVAARGIDINGLSHVVNYSLPYDGATYIHRIGRTGRAGTSGTAITFVRPEERRKLEFLKNTVRKAAKGELNEEEIPSVKKVLEVKRERMLDTLKVQLGLMRDPADVKDGVVYIGGGKAQVEGEDLDKQDDFIPELKAVDAIYTKMAAELCAGQDAQAVLAGILSVDYGKSLDESHYGDITPIRPRGDRFGDRDRGGRRGERGMGGRRDRFDGEERSDQKRLFIQLGRRDGYNARGIADYFSDLLHIPGKMVDRIDVSTNFSLVSLPIASADKVLELSKIGQIPHVHVDSKSGNGGRGGRDRDFDDFGGRSFGGRRDRGGFGRDRDRGFGRDRDRGFGGRDRDRGFGRKTHAQTERNGASSYKKSYKDEF
ncbi:MAG: DEAD/DEAH box helicase [Treponema sp.]|nr:DEAD/DEAH box helicase [Treponema sp.]